MKDVSMQVLQVSYSPYCQCVVIALTEKGVPFSVIEEDLKNKSQRLLEANPVHKKVPVLIHNGRPVVESRVILQYIDEAWPVSPLGHGAHSLFPDTPYEKAQANFWVDFIYVKVAAPLHQMMRAKDSEIDTEAFTENMVLLNSAIVQCSQDEKPFFFGKRFGVVDITFAPFISWFSSFEMYSNLRLPSPERAPRLHEWITALTQHPTIKPVLTDPKSIEQKTALYRSAWLAAAA